MKQLTLILFTIMLFGCSHKHKKVDLMGTWDLVSVTDIETGEVEFPELGKTDFVQVSLDSVYLSWGDTYSWKIEGDSIFIDGLVSVYIKDLTLDELVVEYDFFGEQQVKFNKKN